MARLSDKGTYVILEGINVWYDSKQDNLHITSSDPDVGVQGLHIAIKRGSASDTNLRSLLEVHGVQARPFDPSIPGQKRPVILSNSSDPKRVRQAILQDRKFGFAQISWSPGMNAESLIVDNWDIQGSVLVTGDDGTGKTSLIQSMLTQLIHKNGTGELQITLVERRAELSDYGDIDSVSYHGNAGAEEVYAILERAIGTIKSRAALLKKSQLTIKDLDHIRTQALTDALSQGTRLQDHPLYMPYEIIVIDGWHEMVSQSMRRSPDQVTQLLDSVLKHGRSFGVHVAVTADSGTRFSNDVVESMRRVLFATTDGRDVAAVDQDDVLMKSLIPGQCFYMSRDVSEPVKIQAHSLKM